MQSKTIWSLVGASVLILLALGSLAAVNYLVGGIRTPEILLTLVLILGVIALVAVIGALVSLLRPFGMLDPHEALALPPGSIRAILALMLVLVFAIMSIFLYYQSKSGGPPSTGITQEQLDLLPADRIVAIQAGPPGPNGFPTFNVQLDSSDDTQQLALQLVTLLGTLVTAIAAFYFGSNSVTTALKARDSDSALLAANPQSLEAAAVAARSLANVSNAQAERLEKLKAALEASVEAAPEKTTEEA